MQYGAAYLNIDGQRIRAPLESIKLISVKLQVGEDGAQDVTAKYGMTDDIISLVDFGQPLITESIPAARISGELSLSIETESGVVEKHFWIRAHTILQDQDFPTFYYYVDDRLGERLATISDVLSDR